MSDKLTLEVIAQRQREGRPVYFDDPRQDHLLAMLLELAEEICVQRDRVATAVTLAERGEAVTAQAIDAHAPDAAEIKRRVEAHRAFYLDLLEKLPTG